MSDNHEMRIENHELKQENSGLKAEVVELKKAVREIPNLEQAVRVLVTQLSISNEEMKNQCDHEPIVNMQAVLKDPTVRRVIEEGGRVDEDKETDS